MHVRAVLEAEADQLPDEVGVSGSLLLSELGGENVADGCHELVARGRSRIAVADVAALPDQIAQEEIGELLPGKLDPHFIKHQVGKAAILITQPPGELLHETGLANPGIADNGHSPPAPAGDRP